MLSLTVISANQGETYYTAGELLHQRREPGPFKLVGPGNQEPGAIGSGAGGRL